MTQEILAVRELNVDYQTSRGALRAVNDVSFSLNSGEKFGLVGESGSGKSTTLMAILRLIKPPGYIRGGQIMLDGADLVDLSEADMRRKRLEEIALIPQGAMDSLNPVMRIRDQFKAAMRAHNHQLSKPDLEARVAELLSWVELSEHVADLYPHQLSGGMKQRVCIAIAISLRPKVILADEPTSALDVIVQRRVMETMVSVQERLGSAVLLVGHDMGLMAQFVDRIGIMYGGKLVEIGPVLKIFRQPLHPYTQLLINSLPSLDQKRELEGIPGIPFSLLDPPPGCPFHPRCPQAMDHCSELMPGLAEVEPGRQVSCHLY